MVLKLLTRKATRDTDADADPAVAASNNPTNAIFKITDVTLFVSVLALSTENHFQNYSEHYLKELLNGINIDQK